MLTYFMFPPKIQHTFVSKLSGGEKTISIDGLDENLTF